MCTIRKKSGSKPGQKVTKLSLFALGAGSFCQNWKKNRLLLKMGVFLCNQPNRPLKTAVKPPKIPRSAPENRLFSEFSKNYYAYLRIILIFRQNFHFFCRRGRQNCRPIAVAFPFQFVESRPASPENRHPQTTATPRRRVSARLGGFRCTPAVSAAPWWFPLRPGGSRCTPAVSAATRRFPLRLGGFRYAAAAFSAAAACLQENAPVFAFPGRRLSRRGSANRGDIK